MMRKTIKAGSLMIYSTDNICTKIIRRILHKFNKNISPVKDYVVYMFTEDVDVPIFSNKNLIYRYVGDKDVNVSVEDALYICNFDKSAVIKYINKHLCLDSHSKVHATDISYKDLICLIESSKNWQKSII